MIRILALADDMTGALEVGAKFSSAGIGAVVFAKPVAANGVPVVVFDTETRHTSPEVAAAEVTRFVVQSGAARPLLIYKKTDSTLRGNISAELRALATLYPDWRIGYAPAYPALGRTVRNGILYVDGIALELTAFARDALNPIHASSISQLLHPELACTVFDGETDADLRAAASAILADRSMRIATGPAGLAEMISQQIDITREPAPVMPVVRTCLVMNGSRHERSAIQMRHAEAPGWKVLRREHPLDADPARVAAENGKYVVEQVAAGDPDAVFAIGGDTAFSVVAALGLPPLAPIGEVVAGVAVARIKAADIQSLLPARNRDLLFITKAGGFGEPDMFRRMREKLDTDAK
jgi:uncharacterized protein YgbK (DUF1537 family)